MDLDDLLPVPANAGDPLNALRAQDLDRLSRDELDERLAVLRAEVARTETRRAAVKGVRSAADALFRRA